MKFLKRLNRKSSLSFVWSAESTIVAYSGTTTKWINVFFIVFFHLSVDSNNKILFFVRCAATVFRLTVAIKWWTYLRLLRKKRSSECITSLTSN